MKPAAFDYFAPKTIDEALTLLAEYGYDAKPLAGGQSLVPTMNFRLAQPAVLIDLNGVDDLFFIRESDDGLRIGAMTRQRVVERSPLVQRRAPLVHETMPHIAHPQIRNRGTFGGSLAHADPASELPVLAVILNARMRLQNSQGARWVEARDFYLGLFATDLQPDELLVEIAIPDLPARTGWAFDEVARRHGDYALAGVAATVALAADGSVDTARLVYLSVGDFPTQAFHAESLLAGEQPTPAAIRAAGEVAAAQDIDPIGEIHASADFRRHLAKVLAVRVLTKAVERVKER